VKRVHPTCFVIANMALEVETDELELAFKELGAEAWFQDDQLDAPSDNEALIEIGGRLCYKSFGKELNANLTRVREGNEPYLGNILQSKHGSVLEHSVTSVLFVNVSRIFTHEEVRHRAGTAFSQESMRFVRLDDIPIWIPDLTPAFHELGLRQDPKDPNFDSQAWAVHMQDMYDKFLHDACALAENRIAFFTTALDKEGVPFHLKKTITSALRRGAPSGHATSIMVTANHRAWRHMIEQRTSPGAEVEIQMVFGELAEKFKSAFPNLYQDMDMVVPSDGGYPSYVFKNSKV
jgi:thymidylate synthase (FAD)